MFSFFLKFCHSFDQLVTVVWLVSIITNRIGQQEVLWTMVAEPRMTMVYPWSWHQGNKQLLNEVKHDIQKLNSIIVLLYIFLEAFSYFELPSQFAKVWEHYKD